MTTTEMGRTNVWLYIYIYIYNDFGDYFMCKPIFEMGLNENLVRIECIYYRLLKYAYQCVIMFNSSLSLSYNWLEIKSFITTCFHIYTKWPVFEVIGHIQCNEILFWDFSLFWFYLTFFEYVIKVLCWICIAVRRSRGICTKCTKSKHFKIFLLNRLLMISSMIICF